MDNNSYVRRCLSFVCFSSNAEMFEKVRKEFVGWHKNKNVALIETSKALDGVMPDKDGEFVWYRKSRQKFVGILLLFCMAPYYPHTNNGDQIIEIMHLISKGQFPSNNFITNIMLRWYWDEDFMQYLDKAVEVIEMKNDDEFKNLPLDFTEWLNQ